MQTHYSRVRTDFKAEQTECKKGRYWHAPTKDADKPCLLPDECELCKYWVCNACERVVPWGNGGGEIQEDGGGLLCDECWCEYISGWHDAQEAVELYKMLQYERGCAL